MGMSMTGHARRVSHSIRLLFGTMSSQARLISRTPKTIGAAAIYKVGRHSTPRIRIEAAIGSATRMAITRVDSEGA